MFRIRYPDNYWKTQNDMAKKIFKYSSSLKKKQCITAHLIFIQKIYCLLIKYKRISLHLENETKK